MRTPVTAPPTLEEHSTNATRSDFSEGGYARRLWDSRVVKVVSINSDTVVCEDVWGKREHVRFSQLFPMTNPAQYLCDNALVTQVRQLIRVNRWPDLTEAVLTLARQSNESATKLGVNDIVRR